MVFVADVYYTISSYTVQLYWNGLW